MALAADIDQLAKQFQASQLSTALQTELTNTSVASAVPLVSRHVNTNFVAKYFRCGNAVVLIPCVDG